MSMKIQDIINKLKLEPHPEGGYYRENYRSTQIIPGYAWLPTRSGPRVSVTSIYFLLETDQVSKWHRLKSDELWYYHMGEPVLIHTFNHQGEYKALTLGINLDLHQKPQVLLTAGTYFGAELLEKTSFSLIGCMVTPGFEFADFELITIEKLKKLTSNHSEIIERLG